MKIVVIKRTSRTVLIVIRSTKVTNIIFLGDLLTQDVVELHQVLNNDKKDKISIGRVHSDAHLDGSGKNSYNNINWKTYIFWVLIAALQLLVLVPSLESISARLQKNENHLYKEFLNHQLHLLEMPETF